MDRPGRRRADDVPRTLDADTSYIGRIDPFGLELSEPELERSYRAAFADESRSLRSLGLSVLGIPILAFAYTDADLYGFGSTFAILVVLRALVTLAAIAIVVAIRRRIGESIVDRTLLAWWLLFATTLTAIDATRPPDDLLHVAIDVLIVLTAYLLPNRFAYQFASGLAITVGCLGTVAITKHSLSSTQWLLVATSSVYANVLGIVLSRRQHASARERFVGDARMRRAKSQLLALRRLVPVCANCKSIRTAEGEWRKVEEYVATETGSDVTHGLCPDCVRALYPNVADRVLANRLN